MSKIATEQEAKNISGSIISVTEPNKCCTKTRATALQCSISGTYEDNQLVQLSDLSVKKTISVGPDSVDFSRPWHYHVVISTPSTANITGTVKYQLTRFADIRTINFTITAGETESEVIVSDSSVNRVSKIGIVSYSDHSYENRTPWQGGIIL